MSLKQKVYFSPGWISKAGFMSKGIHAAEPGTSVYGLVVVRIIRGEPYCDYCKSFTYGRARYVKKLYSRKRRETLMEEADLGD